MLLQGMLPNQYIQFYAVNALSCLQQQVDPLIILWPAGSIGQWHIDTWHFLADAMAKSGHQAGINRQIVAELVSSANIYFSTGIGNQSSCIACS